MWNKRGFTLVELLVVVAIITLLSVVSATTFFKPQGDAKNIKRKSDLDAILKAYELNFNYTTNTYKAVTGSEFSGGSLPSDPSGWAYCIAFNEDMHDPDYLIMSGDNPRCPGDYYPIDSAKWDNSALTFNTFKVCVALEDNGGRTYLCRTSGQGITPTPAS